MKQAIAYSILPAEKCEAAKFSFCKKKKHKQDYATYIVHSTNNSKLNCKVGKLKGTNNSDFEKLL